ncbi:DUF6520 family protein [Flavobacterium hibisci]|uniref:Uncharacterized protein n=2 Tax=Flavobacterium cutihirudinis TaxID=1265740 RepID=A0A3D9G1C3_9FLAO|nr:DUF6520 family protein [Flavobacterium hibisci]RED27000.1 hypothetical protein BD847_0931 [Flavobacterium cutihirudinis]
MKTLNLKNMLPAAVIAMAVGGAFMTTSMQSSSKLAQKDGYTRNSQNECSTIQVNCSDNPLNSFCRVSGAQAYEKPEDSNICTTPLYKPD